MTYFKFRNKEYSIERDSHQFILSQKTGKEYVNIGYYSDPAYLVRKLISLHLIKSKDGADLLKDVRATCTHLSSVIEKAIKAPPITQVKRSTDD